MLLVRVNASMMTVRVEDRPTVRERDVLELFQTYPQMTSGDISSHLYVSRQQAHKLLAGLVEKGYAKKEGITKSSYYTMHEDHGAKVA